MFCPNCGKEIVEGVKFCPECGANIKAILKPTPPRVEKFSANEVILSEMLANATVKVGSSNTIMVTIKGDEETKQKAQLEQSSSALKISAPFPFIEGGQQSGFGGMQFGGSVVISGSMSGISMVNGQLMINGQVVDMKRTITVEIEVPEGTTVKVGKMVGNCSIGDTEGDLQVKLSGTTKVRAGKIRSAHLKVSGSGDIGINEINGSIEARVSGAGNITINRGKATSFNATVSGAGNITFNGVADTADMSVSGAGDIYLAECKTAPHKSKSGVGSIRVGTAPKSASSGFDNW